VTVWVPTAIPSRVAFVTSPVSAPSMKIAAPSGVEVTVRLPVRVVSSRSTVAVSPLRTVTGVEASA
jgi:hypothetical protein